MGWTKLVLLKVFTSARFRWKGNIAQGNEFRALVCVTNFVSNPSSHFTWHTWRWIPLFRQHEPGHARIRKGAIFTVKESYVFKTVAGLWTQQRVQSLPVCFSVFYLSPVMEHSFPPEPCKKIINKDDFWSLSPNLSPLPMCLFLQILFKYQN